MMPMLRELREVQDIEVTRDMPAQQRGKIARAKLEAAKAIPEIRAVLFPEDDDG